MSTDLTELASWAPYMGNGYKAQKYPDSQNLFALGRAAIYPAGSWDIPVFHKQADFEIRRLRAAAARGPATPATSATTPTSPWA